MSTIDTTEIQHSATTTLTEAKAFRIATAPQFEEAGAKLMGIKTLLKKIADTFDPHIKRAHDAHKSLVAEKKQHEAPLMEAEGHVKRAMLGFQQEQERIRLAAEAKAQEAARKEREKLVAQAAKAAEKGKTEKAEALQMQAAAVVTPILAPTTPKLAGISTRITYKATVVDKLALIVAVAEGKVPLNAVDVNMPFLNNQARAMRETLAYPGVKVETETGIASRSA